MSLRRQQKLLRVSGSYWKNPNDTVHGGKWKLEELDKYFLLSSLSFPVMDHPDAIDLLTKDFISYLLCVVHGWLN